MSMTVGSAQYHCTCRVCDTEFEVVHEDLNIDRDGAITADVTCPTCGTTYNDDDLKRLYEQVEATYAEHDLEHRINAWESSRC